MYIVLHWFVDLEDNAREGKSINIFNDQDDRSRPKQRYIIGRELRWTHS